MPLAPGRANSEQSARMSQLLKSSGAMSAATMTSRVLGLVREMVYARFMGDTWVAGAFTLAFMVPNLFRRLLGEGVLTAAFIPVFKEKEKTEGDAEMWRAANAVLSGLIASASVVTVLAVAGISLLLQTQLSPAQTRGVMGLLAATFPYVVGLSVVALLLCRWSKPGGTSGRFTGVFNGAATLAVVAFLGIFGVLAFVLWLDLREGQTLLMLKLLRGLRTDRASRWCAETHSSRYRQRADHPGSLPAARISTVATGRLMVSGSPAFRATTSRCDSVRPSETSPPARSW